MDVTGSPSLVTLAQGCAYLVQGCAYRIPSWDPAGPGVSAPKEARACKRGQEPLGVQGRHLDIILDRESVILRIMVAQGFLQELLGSPAGTLVKSKVNGIRRA